MGKRKNKKQPEKGQAKEKQTSNEKKEAAPVVIPKFKMVGSRAAVVEVFVGFYELAVKGTVTISKESPLHSGKRDTDEVYTIGDISTRKGVDYGNVYKSKVGQRAMLLVIKRKDPVGFSAYLGEVKRAKTEGEKMKALDAFLREYLRAWDAMGWIKRTRDDMLYCTLTRGKNKQKVKAVSLSTRAYRVLKALEEEREQAG